jgi:hypothetical protein
MWFFDTTPIEQRLQDPQFGFETVSGAADYAAVKSVGDFRPGTVYVVLAGDRNGAGSAPQARGRAAAPTTFGVIVAARNYRDASGRAALQEAGILVGNARKAVFGWTPPHCTPCIWLQGDVLDYDRSNLLWIDVYTTTYTLGGTP